MSVGTSMSSTDAPVSRLRAAAVSTLGSRRRPPLGLTLACVWLGTVAVCAIFAGVLPLKDPDVNLHIGLRVPPFHTLAQPLGTDAYGRSVLSRVIYGARVSLVTGLVSAAIALTIGAALGAAAGYLGRTVDGLVGLLVDSVFAFPGLVLLIALAATLQPSEKTVIIGLSILAIPPFARVARARTLQLRDAEFVLAARGLGASTPSILVREILPDVLSSMATYTGVIVATLILAESSLSFLGLGIQPPQPTWGNMMQEGSDLLQQSPALLMVPAALLFLTVLAIGIIGERLRRQAYPGVEPS